MPYQNLSLDERGGALRITLARPGVLNALSLELLSELRTVLTGPATDDGVRAVLITGAGRAFCAGADLASTSVSGDIGAILEESYHPVVRAIAALPKPVVAGVNGVAAGAGLSLALACDMRLLSDQARFTVAFTGVGLVMDAGCSYFLPRLVGLGRAMELAVSNRRVDAAEALSIGLGDSIIPAANFAEDAFTYSQRLAEGPTLSYALVKRELRASLDNDLEAQLKLESASQSEAAASRDVREGVAAFSPTRRDDGRAANP